MKRIMTGALALVLSLVFSFVNAAQTSAQKLSIVTTIFPIYDWVREVTRDVDGIEITMLLDNGVDLHSYQPTAQDIMKVATCDVFVYVGGESDEWVEDALKEAVNPELRAIDLVEMMGDGVKLEEIVEGMEHDHDHEEEDHDHEEEEHEHEEEEHDHEDEVDEHIWLSLRNARKLVTSLATALGEVDPANAQIYAANAEAYSEKLATLDAEYMAVRAGAEVDTLLFGDRFPFRYLVDDLDLNYYAAFSGCSAETEASFETIVFLAGKLDELALPAVMTIEGTDHRIAQTIVDSAQAGDVRILSLDSMQGTTWEDVQNGDTYLSIMGSDLEVLRQALTR